MANTMFDSLNVKFKRLVRPATLPLWIRLQDTASWQFLTSAAHRLREDRSFKAFGVGLPKTGTQSLAFMLRDDYRAKHEPEVWTLTYLLLQDTHWQGVNISQSDVLKSRDHFLNLEFESSWVLGLNIKSLYNIFPDRKYILTVRKPIPWLNSKINQEYEIGNKPPWNVIYEYKYSSFKHFSDKEIGLSEHGLHSIDDYFLYWYKHIKKVIETIPKKRLLIIPTSMISESVHKISNFLEIPDSSINSSRSHSHKRKEKKLDIFDLVEESYIIKRARFFCEELAKYIFEDNVYGT